MVPEIVVATTEGLAVSVLDLLDPARRGAEGVATTVGDVIVVDRVEESVSYVVVVDDDPGYRGAEGVGTGDDGVGADVSVDVLVTGGDEVLVLNMEIRVEEEEEVNESVCVVSLGRTEDEVC